MMPLIDVTQALIACGGAAVSIHLLVKALQDHEWVQHSHSRPEVRYLASARIRQEVGRLLLQVFLVCAGLGAAFLHTTLAPDAVPYIIVRSTALLGVTVGIALASVWDWWDRQMLSRDSWDEAASEEG